MTFELQGLAIQVAGPPSDRWVPSDCHIPIYNSNTVLYTVHSMLLINKCFLQFVYRALLQLASVLFIDAVVPTLVEKSNIFCVLFVCNLVTYVCNFITMYVCNLCMYCNTTTAHGQKNNDTIERILLQTSYLAR